MDRLELALYAAVGIALLFLAWSVYDSMNKPQELADRCQPPPGTDPEQWRQHMSHHPDRYAECLG